MREATIEALRLALNKSLVPQTGGAAWVTKADTRRSVFVIDLKHQHYDLRPHLKNATRMVKHVMTLPRALTVHYKFDQATGDYVCEPLTIEDIHEAYRGARKPRCEFHDAWKKSSKETSA